MIFIIFTDHAVLWALHTKESLEGRMLKWDEALSKHDYNIVYIKGTNALDKD